MREAQKKLSKLELIVVGAGVAGRRAALQLQKTKPELQILVLESSDRVGGKAVTGLHLVNPEAARRFGLVTGPELKQVRVRWDRQWVEPSQVDWSSKEWTFSNLPQWERYLYGPHARLLSLEESEIAVAVKTRSPVRSIQKLTDSGEDLWRLECPEHDYLAPQVVWAAGLLAFQNAYGKMEAQKLCSGNPRFNKAAGDCSGGLSFEVRLQGQPPADLTNVYETLWALPVRVEGKFLLSFGVIESRDVSCWSLQALIHLPAEQMSDAKGLASIQKTLRRAWKQALELQTEESLVQWPAEKSEKWIVQSQIGGQISTQAWVLETQSVPGLHFVGEDTIQAARSQFFDVIAALESADGVSEIDPSVTWAQESQP